MNIHTHNPEIIKVLNGCKTEVKQYTKYKWYCKKSLFFVCGENNYLCPSCKSIIKGIILAQENEIRFLKSIEGISEEVDYILEEKIQDLQTSNADLQEIIK